MFDDLFVRKNFFHTNFGGYRPENFFSGKKFFLPPPPARQHFWGK
jgi:hypothetical protein